MSQHIPGPWVWYLSDAGIDLRTPNRGQLLVMDYFRGRLRFAKRTDSLGGLMFGAETFVTKAHKRPGFVEIDNPDARLIAAAPELLAACNSAIVAIEALGTFPRETNAIIRAAIAKVTGGGQ